MRKVASPESVPVPLERGSLIRCYIAVFSLVYLSNVLATNGKFLIAVADVNFPFS